MKIHGLANTKLINNHFEGSDILMPKQMENIFNKKVNTNYNQWA